MKKKTKEFADMTAGELKQQLEEKKKELFAMRLQQVSGQLENPLRIRAARRTVARIKTIMNQAAKAER
jgi:large subunit ribosomal protein L29